MYQSDKGLGGVYREGKWCYIRHGNKKVRITKSKIRKSKSESMEIRCISPTKGWEEFIEMGSGATLDAELTTRYLSVLLVILKRPQIMFCHINQNSNHIPKVYFSDLARCISQIFTFVFLPIFDVLLYEAA